MYFLRKIPRPKTLGISQILDIDPQMLEVCPNYPKLLVDVVFFDDWNTVSHNIPKCHDDKIHQPKVHGTTQKKCGAEPAADSHWS